MTYTLRQQAEAISGGISAVETISNQTGEPVDEVVHALRDAATSLYAIQFLGAKKVAHCAEAFELLETIGPWLDEHSKAKVQALLSKIKE